MKLKTCPFCGAEPELIKSEGIGYPHEDRHKYWVKCFSCNIEQHAFYPKEIAIDKWNQRINDNVEK